MPSTLAERAGKFDLSVATCAHTPESAARWERRVETLTAWLLAQWQARQQEGEHVERDD